MWVPFIWFKPLGRMWNNILKWLVIFLLNNLALFWWTKLDQVITGFAADISFSKKNHWSEEDIIFENKYGFPWKFKTEFTTPYIIF